VRLLHGLAKIHATFDDPDLVSRAGLVPVMALAQRVGLAGVVDEQVRIARPCGVNPQVKVPCVVAGMIGGADSIDDLGLLRHGAMPVLFGGSGRRPRWGRSCGRSPGGTCCNGGRRTGCCWVSWPAAPRCCPAGACWPLLIPASWQRRVYGHQKQGAGFGHAKIQSKSLLVRRGRQVR
jgi:hypothetical protein